MFDVDRWQEVYHALKSNKLRTALTMFGVFWGIFMLIIMMGAGNGLENGVYSGMGDFATNSVFMWSQRTTKPYKGFPKGRSYNFNNDDTKAILQNIPEVKTLAPRIQAWGGDGQNNVIRGERTGAFNVLGDYPEYNEIDPMNIEKGRFINDFDIQERRKVTVLGTRVVDVLFENDEKVIGEYVKIQGVYFKVVGVFSSKHTGGWAEQQEQSLFMPFTTLQKTYNYGNTVGYYSLVSYDDVRASAVEEEVKTLLRKRHSIHPEDKEAIGSHNVEEEFLKFKGLFNGIAILVWIVGTGTLIAGVIGVSNIMLVIVKERTREIGIQRALGAKPWNVITQILTEAVVLTSIAGFMGLLAGAGVLELVSSALAKNPSDNAMFTQPGIDFGIAVNALIILIIAGLFAGFIPAKRAVNIKPIEALRTE
jgi:putative ABC transport system permease protein